MGAVEFGEVQQQIAAVGAESVQRTYLREPFGDRAAWAGPLPEVHQRGVRLPVLDPGGLGLADAVDVGECEPQPPGTLPFPSSDTSSIR